MMRAAFLDLNGTLVEPEQVTNPRELTLLPFAIEAVRLLTNHQFLCPVVTVQSRISKAIFSLDDFLVWFTQVQQEMERAGAALLGPYICPHQGRDVCECKKPHTSLYQQAASDNGIDIAQSVVIGDTWDDMRAAQALGIPGCLVRTGWGERHIHEHQADQVATYVARNVLEAARWAIAR